MIDYAKRNRASSQRSSSNGSPGHVGGELFKHMSGTEIVHIRIRGGAAAINDLIAGRVELMFESLNRSRRMRAPARCVPLAVSGAAPLARLPDLRPSPRAGVPGYEAPTWSGVRDRRDPAADHRQAQRRDQPRHKSPVFRSASRDRRRAAAAVRKSSPSDPQGLREVARGGAALGAKLIRTRQAGLVPAIHVLISGAVADQPAVWERSCAISDARERGVKAIDELPRRVAELEPALLAQFENAGSGEALVCGEAMRKRWTWGESLAGAEVRGAERALEQIRSRCAMAIMRPGCCDAAIWYSSQRGT